MSSHASAASEDWAAQNCLDSVSKRIPSESEREPVTEIPSESEGETVPEIPSQSERDPVPEIPSESEREPVPEIPSQSERDPVPEIPSESEREPVTEIPSESEGETVPEIPSKSERDPVPEIPCESEREPVPEIPSKSERDPVPEISSESEREPVPEIPSKSEIEPISEIPSKSEREPVPEIPSKSEIEPISEIPSKSKPKPRLEKIPTESESDLDAESDDGQQRLRGPSLYGKKPRRWISKEEWDNNMKEDPHVGLRLLRVTIFKIPNFLKDIKRRAYVPQGVSLGPFHHGSAELTAMDHYKGRALRNMMTRFNNVMALDVDDVIFADTVRDAIGNREGEIRDCYEESIDCDGNTLSMMLTWDGCFILEVLRTLDERGLQRGIINAPIFGENMVAASNTLKDILMLENQIPWIVLQELLRMENPPDTDAYTTLLNVMVKGTCGLFKMSIEDTTALLELDWLRSANLEVHHLLGFVHNVIVYRPAGQAKGELRISTERCIGRCLQMLQDKNKAQNYDFESIPPAVELKNAGIKFRPCNGGIEQVRYDQCSSTIYLPLLSITYDTEVLFRNLIALEMCKSSEVNYVSSYVNLMDDLIDSEKDVAFLRSMGILTNLLGSNQEVADLLNGLFKGVTVRMPNMFDELKRDVNANYKNRIRVQLAELWRDHFSSPWKTLALAVAFAILCLTLVQTIYTVKK